MNACTESLFAQRLLVLTGKGGVGKTLTSASLAKAAARRGMRTLWVEMTAHPRGGELFSGYTPDYAITPMGDGLWGTNLRLEPAIEEYLGIVFRLPLLARLISRNALFQVLTAAMPGLDALVMLGKIWYEFERRQGDRPYWDKLIVDAPATGHGLSLLRLPAAALDVVSRGPVAERAADIHHMLSDRKKTAIVTVTQLEALAVDEGLSFVGQLERETPYSVAGLLVNGVLPDIAPNNSRYESWLSGHKDVTLLQALGANHFAAREWMRWLEAWRMDQSAQQARLEESAIPVVEAPWVAETSEEMRLQHLCAVWQ